MFPDFVRDLAIVAVLVPVFIRDLRFREIPDRYTVPGIGIVFVVNLWVGDPSVGSMFAGALALGGFFFGQWIVSRGRWIGDGDIRLGAFMGIALGFAPALVALFVAYAIGAVVALMLLAAGRATKNTELPFGVFLTLATAFAMIWGEEVASWYVGLM